MVLNFHSDELYLNIPKGRSRADGFFFLSSVPQDSEPIVLNDDFYVLCTI